MAEEKIGRVSHYFGRIGVAGIDITDGALAVGDTIHIKGRTTDFTQSIESMEIDGTPVQKAQPGQSVGMKLADRARNHDEVYKVIG